MPTRCGLLTEAAQIDPEDMSLRQLLVQAYIARGDFDAACQFATSAEELRHPCRRAVPPWARRRRHSTCWRARLTPIRPTRRFAWSWSSGSWRAATWRSARKLLTPEVAGNDPELLWLLAEMELRDGHIPEGTALLEKMLVDDPEPPRCAGHPRVLGRRSESGRGVRVHRGGGHGPRLPPTNGARRPRRSTSSSTACRITFLR